MAQLVRSLFTSLATLTDVYVAMIKAAIFGFMAAIVGAYKGLNAGGGPAGVGRAVNESVILSFMLLFLIVAAALAWMHFAIRRMEHRQFPEIRRETVLPELLDATRER